MDISAWLQCLGMQRYEEAFRAIDIVAGVLPSLTAEDLKDLGVTLVGHRRRLLNAIAALDTRVPAPPGASLRQYRRYRQTPGTSGRGEEAQVDR